MSNKLMSMFGGQDLRLIPAYTVAEAAHYVRRPEATLRSWVAGRLYPASGKQRRSRPIIRLDDPKRRHLSFLNLVEAHILGAIVSRHGVRLPNVRRALDYVQREFRVERPLIHQEFQTDGLDLFVDRYGAMINASREGQKAMTKTPLTFWFGSLLLTPKARTATKVNNPRTFEEARGGIRLEALCRVLTPAELETLELLFDKHATALIAKSLQEAERRTCEPIETIR